MARTVDEIVQAFLADREERDRLDQEEKIPVPESERAAFWDALVADLNGMDADELERAVDRYREDENVAEAFLEMRDRLRAATAAVDHRDAKIEELITRLDRVEGWNRWMRDEVKRKPDEPE